MMLKFPMLWLLVFSLSPFSSSARPAPYALRISCGARDNVHTPPTYTLWFRDFGYTGGIPYNASRPSDITPPLKTLRYFPLSEGPENCYKFQSVPRGHYSVRIFFGLVPDSDFDNEPLFDISIEGTLIYSMKSGWTKQEDQAFTEALVFLSDGTASICFHSTGHGDPAILSIEILQVDNKAYYFVQGWSEGLILRTAARLTFGTSKARFDEDYSGDHWGGDRYWSPIRNNADHTLATDHRIKQASDAPNFYPEALYQTAVVSSDSQPGLTYTMDVDPNRKYSIWLHFAEIDDRVTGIGQRVFDISINGHPEFQDIDVVKMSGDRYTALVLNTTVAVNGRTLSINLQPKNGGSAIINTIEVFEIIASEFKTLPEEVSALQALKSALGLPHRFGWNGDPCVPQEHPWSGADCHLNTTTNKWFIDGLGLDNQGLRGFLPTDISNLHHLQSINLSGNNIHGAIPSSLGTLTSLELLTIDDNAGLCGIPGLRPCGPHLSASAKIGIGFAVSLCFLLLVICSMCWWKRRQNILRAQMIAARGAPYAKARTHLSHDIQLSKHQNHGHSRTAVENGPSLLS
ncbi:hypothetical protein SLEP1_g13590 [Rubroshorea leprosula]|uniref:Malectin-like domain-containing protein n=1 Tax=Rubroshorea leprosula TaxID=152421 RepID=A0AAV5IQH1_9ROSI|nr:hypothetical protein SLEP1_g13590 [Rubroshorea leprosula]